eukprot:TRINITY_DN648_c0_g2_i1.p1 TRINITY_DN648_c0_g2~~TRINITY_DN648_c0_g2_i1.p1  ORF type:complete len:195 (+),score=34.49 TRINITY_DN648_c0_g2_i1:183-767(+)
MAGTGPPRGGRFGPAPPVERENLMDQKYVSDDTTPKKINSIQFSMMDPHQMLRAAELKVSSRELFADSTRIPAPYGPLDTRLGTSNKKGSCTTCGASVEVCPGHFGVINLALPVYAALSVQVLSLHFSLDVTEFNGFDSNLFACKNVGSEANFSKCTLSKNSAHLVWTNMLPPLLEGIVQTGARHLWTQDRSCG